MARKSRKHLELAVSVSKDTVGYIRLSVLNRDPHGSVENQRLMIEEWGQKHQVPIMRYYIDNGFSGKRFDRPSFQGMIQDIQKGRIDCIVVKDLSRLGRDYITVGYYLEKNCKSVYNFAMCICFFSCLPHRISALLFLHDKKVLDQFHSWFDLLYLLVLSEALFYEVNLYQTQLLHELEHGGHETTYI